MATIKSFTDISQSRKLAEILPLESADMWWLYITAQGKYIAMMHDEPDPHYLARMESYGIKDAAIRCWSLAALLEEIPSTIVNIVGEDLKLHINKDNLQYYLFYENEYTGDMFEIETELYDDIIDACYELILKLHEQNLL